MKIEIKDTEHVVIYEEYVRTHILRSDWRTIIQTFLTKEEAEKFAGRGDIAHLHRNHRFLPKVDHI